MDRDLSEMEHELADILGPDALVLDGTNSDSNMESRRTGDRGNDTSNDDVHFRYNVAVTDESDSRSTAPPPPSYEDVMKSEAPPKYPG